MLSQFLLLLPKQSEPMLRHFVLRSDIASRRAITNGMLIELQTRQRNSKLDAVHDM